MGICLFGIGEREHSDRTRACAEVRGLTVRRSSARCEIRAPDQLAKKDTEGLCAGLLSLLGQLR